MSYARISRLSSVLLVLTVVGMVFIPLLAALMVVLLVTGSELVALAGNEDRSNSFIWIADMVRLIPFIAMFYALDKLRKLFMRYREGLVLTEESAALIVGAGKGLLWVAILEILIQPIESLFSSWDGPGTGGEISIGLGTSEIGFLFVSGLLTVIGWAMKEAARQAEENKAFV